MNNAIEVKDLRIDINGQALIKHANLSLQRGSLTYFFGSNGTGKTTFVKAILGLFPITQGSVMINGQPNTQRNIAQNIAYLPQNPNIDRDFPITVKEMIDLACSSHNNCPIKVDDHLEIFNAQTIKNKKLNELSGGQLQKALIARALIGDKPILILDEPFNHLDHNSEAALVELLKKIHDQGQRTILIITHDQSIVNENSDCILLMHSLLHTGKAKDIIDQHKLEII
jgi:ABC-type Mn2+/Zn2+ transport system ATPase subunit